MNALILLVGATITILFCVNHFRWLRRQDDYNNAIIQAYLNRYDSAYNLAIMKYAKANQIEIDADEIKEIKDRLIADADTDALINKTIRK